MSHGMDVLLEERGLVRSLNSFAVRDPCTPIQKLHRYREGCLRLVDAPNTMDDVCLKKANVHDL